MNLAKEWQLDTLPYWFENATACEAALLAAPAGSYAVRPSGSRADYLVLALHRGGGEALVSTLFRRERPGRWLSVEGEVCESFAAVLRAVLPPSATPLVLQLSSFLEFGF